MTATAASPWAVHRPGTRDVVLMGVAVLGVSMSGPLTALVVAPVLAIAFWRNAAGAAVLLPVLLLRERGSLAGLRPRDLGSSVVAGEGTSSYVVHQGERLGRPSVMTCTVTSAGGRAVSATVQGAVLPIAAGRIRVPT